MSQVSLRVEDTNVELYKECLIHLTLRVLKSSKSCTYYSVSVMDLQYMGLC